MTQVLRRANFPSNRLIGASAPERSGIVHLGLGNFHRAHLAVYTARALKHLNGDWGISAYSHSSSRMVTPMQEQDYLYSVLKLANSGVEAGVVDVHRKVGVATQESENVVSDISEGNHRIVSLTVSEFGYNRSPLTGSLDVDDDKVRADLNPGNLPSTTVGMIARGLEKRSESGESLTVLSCDNLQSSGDTTRSLVLDFVDAANMHADVRKFIESNVSFPNAMVDRIVPKTSDEHIQLVEKMLSVRDLVPVPAEDFSMWVLEDDFAAGRPAWEQAGATFSNEVQAYEMVKLRLLNGSHSLIAYLGILEDLPTISDAWGRDFIQQVVRLGMEKDYLPTFAVPTGFDPQAYIEQLSERWANPLIEHGTTQVGSDGSQKLLQRIPEAALYSLERGEIPHCLALCVAAWIAAVCPPDGFHAPALTKEIREPNLERLLEATRGARSYKEHAQRIVEGGFFPAELSNHEAFTARVTELLELIVRFSAKAAAEQVIQSY